MIITGVAGFIGSHLADLFIKDYEIIGIDNLSTGSIDNISHLKNNNRFKFLKLDVTKSFTINEKINIILHFASPASPIDYLLKPIETLRVGSVGTDNLLKIALKNQAKILVASTSEIYGDPLIHPQKESYYGNVNPVGPRGVYDESKRYLEALTTAYRDFYGLDVRIARIFNTYGPRMRKNDGRAIPTFINQLIRNDNFTVFGNGKQTRSFCYIEDTIDGLEKLLNSNYTYPMNIGNPTELTILELIKKIEKLAKNNCKIIFKPLPKNDPKIRKPCIKLAKKILNWEPKIELDEGLVKTYNFYVHEDDG
jgi:dTDP-glucose 4,6-dehydratase